MGKGKVVPCRVAQLGAVAGPRPRSDYKDNIHPYNWHWLRRYGTAKRLNNGTHEIDLCRWAWALNILMVAAQGGRTNSKMTGNSMTLLSSASPIPIDD